MRISTTEIFSNSLTRMSELQESLTNLQTQISSGIRIQRPSDDPVGASQALKLQEEISINEQYNANIKYGQSRNEIMDNILDGITKVMQRLRDIAVLSSNDTYSQDDRQLFATEVRQLQDELAGLVNSRDGTGQYLFSGFQGPLAPFVERSLGGYDYVGDDGQREVQISGSSYVPVSDSGKDLFVNIRSDEPTVTTSASSGNDPDSTATISVGRIINQSSFELAYPEDYVITFGDPQANQNRRTFTVTRASDGDYVEGTQPAGFLVDATYLPGETIQFNGIEVVMSGDPQPGDVLFVQSTSNQNILNIIERFALALESGSANGEELTLYPEVIGRATPARPTLSNAGNYVAEQTITVYGDDGTEQTLVINANDTSNNIVTNLNALVGVTASAAATEATLDFRTTTADEGDLINFEINGAAISATVGANSAATYANIDAALTAAVGGTLSFVNNGNGTFSFTESSSIDIDVADFEVVDFPNLELSAVSGFGIGDQIQFTLTGSAGQTVNIDYFVGTGDNDELFTQMQADIAGAGLAAVFSVTQSAPGAPPALRYLGDTDGDANVVLSGLTDNGVDDAVIGVTVNTGSTATNNVSGATVNQLRTGIDVNVAAVEGIGTAGFSGVIGDPVTLRDGTNDSSSVAARISVSAQAEYQIVSNVEAQNGGVLVNRDIEAGIIDQLQESLGITIENIDSAIDNILQGRARVGSRLIMLETSLDLNEGINLELRGFLSEIRDLDYTEALTTLNLQTLILEASQNSFVRITQLSLFNFL